MDNHHPPPQPHATTAAHGETHAVGNLKSLLMKCTNASAHEQKAFFEKPIQDFALTVHTPDHPPYAWMIETAIQRLNEEGGSNEAAISEFILEEYKDLPWAHAAYLKHHLQRLSGNGTLLESHDGCYLVGRPRITNDRGSKPGLRVTCTTNRSRGPSPDLNSPNPSSSSSLSYSSSESSSSSESFDLERERKARNRRNKRSQRQKQNARGRGQGRARGRGRGRGRGNSYKEDVIEEMCIGKVRGRGKGRGRGRGNSRKEDVMEEEADDTRMDSMPMVEIQCLVSEDEAADVQVADNACMRGMEMVEIHCLITEDDERIHEKELPRQHVNRDNVDLESQEQQSMVIEIDSVEHERRNNEGMNATLQQNTGDSCSTPSSIIPRSQGSRKVGQQKINTLSRRKPQTGARRGRSRKKETGNNRNQLKKASLMNIENTENMMEQEEGDDMDELIEEVYGELKEATETLHLTKDDEAAEGKLQRKDLHQVDMNSEQPLGKAKKDQLGKRKYWSRC